MAIFIDKNIKVITQGVTGKAGQIHTQNCMAYAYGKNAFVAGVNPKKAGEQILGMPIYASVKEAVQMTGATASVIYVPAVSAASAILEAVDADLDLVVCVTEGIPVWDMLKVLSFMRNKEACGGKKTVLIGPNSPGIIVPDVLKIGIMPSHICFQGSVGVVSQSGTLMYEAISQLTSLGIGQSAVIGVDGDLVGGISPVDVLHAFNEDTQTDTIVMITTIDHMEETLQAAQWCKENMNKPVICFMAGAAVNLHNERKESLGSRYKKRLLHISKNLFELEKRGFRVTYNLAEIGILVQKVLK